MLPSPGPLQLGAAHRTIQLSTGPPSGGTVARLSARCLSLVVSVMVRFLASFLRTLAPMTSSAGGALTSWPAAARKASPGLFCTRPNRFGLRGTDLPANRLGPPFWVTTITGPAASAGVSPQPPHVSSLRFAEVS